MSNVKTTVTNALSYWYLPLIVGALLIIFGLYVFSVPLAAYLTLSILFSVMFFVSGIGEISFALANKDALDGWGWHLVGGIVTVLLGILLMANPGITMATLPYIVGFGMLFKSIQGLGFSIDLKRLGISWGSLATLSVLGIILSFLLLAQPVIAAVSIVAITAMSIVVVGIFGIMLSLQLKKLKGLAS